MGPAGWMPPPAKHRSLRHSAIGSLRSSLQHPFLSSIYSTQAAKAARPPHRPQLAALNGAPHFVRHLPYSAAIPLLSSKRRYKSLLLQALRHIKGSFYEVRCQAPFVSFSGKSLPARTGHATALDTPVVSARLHAFANPAFFRPSHCPHLGWGSVRGEKMRHPRTTDVIQSRTRQLERIPGGFLWVLGSPQRPSIRASRDNGQSLFTACARRRSGEARTGAHPSDTRFPKEYQDPLRRLLPG